MKIEIISFKTKKIVKIIDCKGKSERYINKVDDGININLNHQEYYTLIKK